MSIESTERYYKKEFAEICERYVALPESQKKSVAGQRLVFRGILFSSNAMLLQLQPKVVNTWLEGLVKVLLEAGCDDPALQELVP